MIYAGIFKNIFEHVSEDIHDASDEVFNNDNVGGNSPEKNKVPLNVEITSQVKRTGKVLKFT